LHRKTKKQKNMSGQKKLNKATRNIKVVAIPSKKKEVVTSDKNGKEVVENVQLYKIRPMR